MRSEMLLDENTKPIQKSLRLNRIKRNITLTVKLNAIEFNQIKAFAEAYGTTKSDYVRRKLLEPGY